MKKHISKLSIGIISFLLVIIATCLISIGCSKTDTAVTPFSLTPYECSTIGEINVAELSKLDIVKKQIDANKDTSFVKELDNAGMGWNNINTIYFAISPHTDAQNTELIPNALILIKTDNKINIKKLIPIIEREINVKITSEKINKQMVYQIPRDNNLQVFITVLTDNLIAIGSENVINKTIDLANGKGKSVIDNPELMKLTDNTKRNNMIWVGCVIDENLLKAFGVDPSTIQVQAGLISADYSKDVLTIGGNIKCATKQDAQKILMPAQMLTAMFISNAKNGINAGDISLTASDKELNFKILITKQVLEKLAEQQLKNLPVPTSIIKPKPDDSDTNLKAVTPVPAPEPITTTVQPIKNNRNPGGLDK